MGKQRVFVFYPFLEYFSFEAETQGFYDTRALYSYLSL